MSQEYFHHFPHGILRRMGRFILCSCRHVPEVEKPHSVPQAFELLSPNLNEGGPEYIAVDDLALVASQDYVGSANEDLRLGVGVEKFPDVLPGGSDPVQEHGWPVECEVQEVVKDEEDSAVFMTTVQGRQLPQCLGKWDVLRLGGGVCGPPVEKRF